MTSKSFISMAIKSTRNVTPLIIIDISLSTNFDNNILPEGKAVIKSLGVLSLLSLIFKANLVEMKECVAPESKSV